MASSLKHYNSTRRSLEEFEAPIPEKKEMKRGVLMLVSLVVVVIVLAVNSGSFETEKKMVDNRVALQVTAANTNCSQVVCVNGAFVTGTKNGQIFVYKGIRFAAPMLPPHDRFLRANKLAPTGQIDATKFGSACMQRPSKLTGLTANEISEDCLYLNIYTPQHPRNPGTASLVPVMFWVHGGAFMFGTGKNFNGTELALKGGVVVVTINYRLGAFGFYSPILSRHPDFCGRSCRGMNGIRDQIVALEWVNEYIHAFGGNKAQITLFGESAGATSVCALIFSSQATRKFNKVIIESGACNGPWGPAPKWAGKALSAGFQGKFHLKHGVRNLHSVDPWKIADMNYFLIPSVDDYVLWKTIPELMLSPTVWNGQDFLLGSNSRDGLTMLDAIIAKLNNTANPDPISSRQEFEDRAKCFLHSWKVTSGKIATLAANVTNMYDLSLDWQDNYYRWNSDLCLACPSRDFAYRTAKQAGKHVYIYEFSGPESAGIAVHGAELTSVWGNYSGSKFFRMLPGAQYNQALSDKVQTAWTNFAKSGSPNAATASWQEYKVASQVGVNISGVTFHHVAPKWRVNSGPPNCAKLDELFPPFSSPHKEILRWNKLAIGYGRGSFACLSPFLFKLVNLKFLCAVINGGYSNEVQMQSYSSYINMINKTTPAPTKSSGVMVGGGGLVSVVRVVLVLVSFVFGQTLM